MGTRSSLMFIAFFYVVFTICHNNVETSEVTKKVTDSLKETTTALVARAPTPAPPKDQLGTTVEPKKVEKDAKKEVEKKKDTNGSTSSKLVTSANASKESLAKSKSPKDLSTAEGHHGKYMIVKKKPKKKKPKKIKIEVYKPKMKYKKIKVKVPVKKMKKKKIKGYLVKKHHH